MYVFLYACAGQVLVNWLVSSFGTEERRKDARLLLPQICTDLVTAGVIKQIRDKDAEVSDLFRVSRTFMYEYTEHHPEPAPRRYRLLCVLLTV